MVNGETPHLSNLDVDLSAAISRNDDIINLNYDADGLTTEEDDTDYTYDYMDYSEYVEDEEVTQTNEVGDEAGEAVRGQ